MRRLTPLSQRVKVQGLEGLRALRNPRQAQGLEGLAEVRFWAALRLDGRVHRPLAVFRFPRRQLVWRTGVLLTQNLPPVV